MNANGLKIAEYLERRAVIGEPVTYGALITNFAELPRLSGAWKSHPLCAIFGDLDLEDAARGRPFRTALVNSAERGMPGQGFFETLAELRHIDIARSEQLATWVHELKSRHAFYADEAIGK